MARPEWIEVGRISRAHGVHGEVRVLSTSDNPERFALGSVLHARPERVGIAGPRLRQQVRLEIETVRGDESFPIVGFCQIQDRDAAEALRGYILEVRSCELPELEEGEFYPFDLIDLDVRDPAGLVVGRVSDLVESPAHGLLVVTGGRLGDAEILVPFVDEAVPVVAVAEGYVVVEPRFLLGDEDPTDGGACAEQQGSGT